MALTDGPLAASLGEHFRTRWRTAVGPIPPLASSEGDDLWPPGVAPDIENAPAAIGRTAPAWRTRPEIQEIEALTLEAIAAARQLIYLENQYFTWPIVVEALAARLAEPNGPQVVLVCTGKSPSYFDRLTMDRARSTAIWRLNASDVFKRFHPLAPRTADGRLIIAHAKNMIIDDRLARISSANLNNRSYGFDTEAELAVEAVTDEQKAALALLRNRLAGHWIGHGPEAVAEMTRLKGGLAEALWALDGGRRLQRLTPTWLGPIGEFIADFHIGDPADPADSWRPWGRRQRLIDEARRVREALASTAS
jgi:phosphatidylserine/phosphatidylglycerophosphate/cardiolipin synthase-like enzyme